MLFLLFSRKFMFLVCGTSQWHINTCSTAPNMCFRIWLTTPFCSRRSWSLFVSPRTQGDGRPLCPYSRPDNTLPPRRWYLHPVSSCRPKGTSLSFCSSSSFRDPSRPPFLFHCPSVPPSVPPLHPHWLCLFSPICVYLIIWLCGVCACCMHLSSSVTLCAFRLYFCFGPKEARQDQQTNKISHDVRFNQTLKETFFNCVTGVL